MRISLAIVPILVLACVGRAAFYDGQAVHGDSLSDGGNVFAMTGGTLPYPTGRFSNGLVWPERLAADLGLALTPSVLGGTNYAFGGAETGLGTSLLRGQLPVPGVRQQVVDHVASAGTLSAHSLQVVSGGPNDPFDGFFDPQVSVNNLLLAIQGLQGGGARRILVADAPNLGLAPEFWHTALEGPMTQWSLGFNAILAGSLHAYPGALVIESAADKLANPGWYDNPGLTIFHLQTNVMFEDMIAHGANYGFTNVTTPVFDSGTSSVIGDPTHFLFWDTVHPTAAAHAFLGDAAAALVAVPEPMSIAVLGVAVVGLVLRRRMARA